MTKTNILLIENDKRTATRLTSRFKKRAAVDVTVCAAIEDGLGGGKFDIVFVQAGLLRSWKALSVRRLERRFQCPVVLLMQQSQMQAIVPETLAAFDYVSDSPTAREIDLILETAFFRYEMRQKVKRKRKRSHHKNRSEQEATKEAIEADTYRVSFKLHGAVQMLVDAETGEILDANQAAQDFYGHSIDAFKTLKAWDLNAGEPAEVKLRLKRALSTENAYFETTHRLASGEERDVEIYFGRIRVKGRELLCPVVHDITDRRRIEEEKARLLASMKERMKELRCIYRVTKAVRARTPLTDIFYQVLSYMPCAWQYPEITRCNLRFDSIEYTPFPFEETPWRLSSYIEVEGQIRGAIEVYYVEERPRAIEGPFLREERDLLEGIASALGEAIALRESGERITGEKDLTRKIMDSLPGLCYVIDTEGRFVRWNKNYEVTTGYSTEEISRSSVFELADPEEWEAVKLNLEKMFTSTSFSAEANLRTRDGRNIPYLFTASKITMDGQECLAGLGLDIAQQKKTETELRNLNAFLDSIVENIPHVIFLKDKEELRYIRCNHAFEAFSGISREDLIGKTDYEIFPEADAESFNRDDKKALTSHEILDVPEEAIFTRNRGVRIVHTKKIPIPGDDGEPKYLLGISEDITERKSAEDKVRQYADIVENMQVGLFVFQLEDARDDHSFRLINANPAAAQLTGIPREDVLGKTIDQNFPKLREMGLPQTFSEVIRSGEARSFDDFSYSDDRMAPGIYSLKAFPLPNRCVGVVFENVTTRREAEEQLQNLSHAVEQSASAVVILDRAGYIEYVNPQFTYITGYEAEEAVGKDALSLECRRNDAEARQELARAIEEGTKWRGELAGTHKNGTEFWVSVTLSPILNKHGKMTHFVDIESDITERKRQEKRLIESEEKYRQFFEEDLTGDYITTADGRLQICNSAFVRMFGFDSVQSAVKCNMADLFRDKQQYANLLAELRSNKKLDYYECELLRQDGGRVQVIQNVKGIFDDNGKLLQFQGYMFDDTRRKDLEVQIRQSQKMEAIGTLAGGIAHDFNNILAAIIGFAELAQDDVAADSRVGENLASIFEAGMRARDLVRQILSFSRQTEHELKPVRLDLIVREVMKFLRASLPPTIEIVERVDKESGLVLADPSQLHQVVMNLCTNAYQAMIEADGILTIFLGRRDTESENGSGDSPTDYIRLSVYDTGSGMDEATLERIFDPFFTTKKVGEGTGLGLSVVHGIVKSLNGHVHVDSKLGKGTAIHIDLPRLEDKAIHVPQPIKVTATGHEMVLLVDDEKLFLEMGKRMLERLGYQVHAVPNGQAALDLFKEDPGIFDVVVVDYIMPKMKGSDLAERLLKIRADVPIILITGFSDELSADKVRKMGVRDCLSKPVVAHQLSQAIRSALNHQT